MAKKQIEKEITEIREMIDKLYLAVGSLLNLIDQSPLKNIDENRINEIRAQARQKAAEIIKRVNKTNGN